MMLDNCIGGCVQALALALGLGLALVLVVGIILAGAIAYYLS